MSDLKGTDAYVRALDASAREECRRNALRYSQELIGRSSGGTNCAISYIVVPVGSGSPAGLHTHEVDQMFFMLQGVLNVEIAGVVHGLTEGSLVFFPAGVPHRNWNDSDSEAIYLAINAPLPPEPTAVTP